MSRGVARRSGVLVAAVILGGIKSIGRFTGVFVPLMIVLYMGGAGLMALIRMATGGRLPKWLTPVAAGGAMIAATVSSEYSWYSRTTATLPEGFEAQIRPRSGLAIKQGLSVLNAPGTIDADYRGEVGVILINHGAEPFDIKRGERIAQLIIAPVTQGTWLEVETLDGTVRGQGGFGSSGSC